MPLNPAPVPVTSPDPLIRMAPVPVAVCWAKMPRPARPATGPAVVMVIEPAGNGPGQVVTLDGGCRVEPVADWTAAVAGSAVEQLYTALLSPAECL